MNAPRTACALAALLFAATAVAAETRPDADAARRGDLLRFAAERIERGEPAEAERVLLELGELGASDDGLAAACVTLADRLAQAGWIDRATRLLRDAVEADPSRPEARLKLAEVLAMWSSPRDAVEAVAPLLAQRPRDPRAVRVAVLAWLAAGDAARAGRLLADHEHAFKGPDDPAIEALVLLGCGEAEAARALTEGSLADTLDPDSDPDPLTQLVAALAGERAGDAAAAREYLLAACRAHPWSPAVVDRLAALLTRHPSDLDADATFSELRSVSPVFGPIAEASAAMRRGDADAAIATLNAALDAAIASRHPGAIDLAEAVAAVRRERREPTHSGFARLAASGWLPARAVLRAADWRAGTEGHGVDAATYAKGYGMLTVGESATRDAFARRLIDRGHADAALAALTAACDNGSADTPTRRLLARQLAERGDPRRAVRVLEDALELRPRHAGLAMQLAETLMLAGRPADAERAWRGAMRLNPVTRGRAAAALADALASMGLDDEAFAVLSEAIDADGSMTVDDAAARLRLAEAAAARGRFDEAATAWRGVLERDPGHAEATIGLARLALASGRAREAEALIGRFADARPGRFVATLAAAPLDDDADALIAFAERAIDPHELPRRLAAAWAERLATKHAHADDWPAVEAALASLVESSPDDEAAAALLAAVRLHLGDIEGARRAASRTLDLDPRRPDALCLALGLEARGSRTTGGHDELWLALIRGDATLAHAASMRMPHGLTIFRDDVAAMLTALPPDAPGVAHAARRVAAAMVALEHDMPRLAAALARDAVQAETGFVVAYGVWAEAVRRVDRDFAAVAGAVNERLPDSRLAVVLAGLLAAERGDAASAAASFREALRSEPRNPHVLFRLAEAEAAAGDPAAALRRLAELRRLSPAYREPTDRLTIELVADHRPDRLDAAARLARRVFGDAPPPSVLAALGRAAAAGDPNRAAAWLTRSARGGAVDPATHLAWAAIHEARGDVAHSLRHLAAATANGADASLLARAESMRDRLLRAAVVPTP